MDLTKVLEMEEITVSKLQRTLSLGFNNACRLVKQMLINGVVIRISTNQSSWTDEELKEVPKKFRKKILIARGIYQPTDKYKSWIESQKY